MRPTLPLRLIAAALVAIAAAVLLLVLLTATDTLLSVWERLSRLPGWLIFAYFTLLLIVAGGGTWLTWRLLRGPRKEQVLPAPVPRESPKSLHELSDRLARRAEMGVDTVASARELETLASRKAGGQIYVAVFGKISAGKSSVIASLLPEARIRTEPTAGTTQDISYYTWTSPAGDELVLADLPGFAQKSGAALSKASHDEALRAHLVIYVCDGDLDRLEHRYLAALREYGKPLILTVNKADLLTDTDKEQLFGRLREAVEYDPNVDVVAIAAGGRQEVIVENAEGTQQRVVRYRQPKLSDLLEQLHRRLNQHPEQLEEVRDFAIFKLAERKLDEATSAFREREAGALVRKYSRRAVIGALAAVTPGADLVIQGALASKLIHSLCRIYEVPLKQVELDAFLKLAGGRVRNATSITLAVAGNAFKAFPGLGTIAGGLMHAVAYGMIFDSLGRAAVETLATHGEFQSQDTIEKFEANLLGQMEARARDFAELALEHQSANDEERETSTR